MSVSGRSGWGERKKYCMLSTQRGNRRDKKWEVVKLQRKGRNGMWRGGSR